MPNWCYTNYVIESNKEQIQKFKKKLDELDKPTDCHQNPWIGDIVKALDGNINDFYCRGWIIEYRIDETSKNILRLTIESAWGELDEVRKLFSKRYPNVNIYFYAEEPGNEVFETNDTKGKYFPDRYIIDSDIRDTEYFTTLKDVVDYVENITGKRPEPTAESIVEILNKYEEESDKWILFHEINIVL